MAKKKIKILFVTPEAHPLIKTGGLGDIGGALPGALQRLGLEVRILLPAYPDLIEQTKARLCCEPIKVLTEKFQVQLFLGQMPNDRTPVYLIDAPALYHRSNPYVDENGYDWPDNAFRFAVLSRVAAIFATNPELSGWEPHIIHCNDWQTGLVPLYMALNPKTKAQSVFTIHNMSFQGIFPPYAIFHLALPRSSYAVEGIEFHQNISFLKAGLYYADHITTVSPSYAKEILTAEYGYGLEGLLIKRKERLTAIINGIDTKSWNPRSDPYLPAIYSQGKLQGKAINKRALQHRFGLESNLDVPLLAMVSRLTMQKGIDLLLDIADRLLQQPVQLIVMGSGESCFESILSQLRKAVPKKIGVHIGYDEALCHLIEAGADIFLMPSRYEPCGLNQMYSMRYGTPPVVRAVGGLADTVVDATPLTLANRSATGFVFAGESNDELFASLLRALILYQNRPAWRKLQINGMKQDFGLDRCAARYLRLYQALITGRVQSP